MHFLKTKTKLFAIIISVGILFCCEGCSSSKKNAPEFEEPAKQNENAVFEQEREKQKDLAAFTASAGRKNPTEKRKISKGETFLLSDKAKEIYANTERD